MYISSFFQYINSRFNRITCLLFLDRGKQKKKPVTGQHRRTRKTALLARSNALLWELTISYLAVVIRLLYYIILLTCGSSSTAVPIASIDSLFFFVDITFRLLSSMSRATLYVVL